MVFCPSCKSDLAAGARYCGECGAALDVTSAPTVEVSSSRSPEPHAEGRFLPGAMLARRYRIVGLLGQGGMGDVYRADDLKLGQPVSLKFLPVSLAGNPGQLERFLNEVKLARQVSHGAVCRVYDVGEADGRHYLSMEYVDGEDLSSLLRRIGHLPRDKAVQIARQICAGLAAVHEQGMLHRDLKPANVMIDGRGRAKMTDFGLASLTESVTGPEAASGTPAYMAPEQLAGREFTQKSDIYALGLVLYELFTGKRAFAAKSAAELRRLQEESSPSSPSTHIEGFDPVVERVIMRCLERDPHERPTSALAVAAALPGGDPLAAALAAGETPSPDMVADAGTAGGLSPRIAVPLLAFALAGLVGTAFVSQQRLDRWPPPRSPEDLILQSRRIIEANGHEAARDREYGMGLWSDVRIYLTERFEEGDRSLDPRSLVPSPITFWYRLSPEPLFASRSQGFVGWDEPPFTEPQMVRLRLDANGRLLEFGAVPPDFSDAAPVSEPDWSSLLEEAGLDSSTLADAAPAWTFPVENDAARAWTGLYPDQPDVPIRIEGRSWRGRVTAFRVIPPWVKPREVETADDSSGLDRFRDAAIQLIQFAVILGALLLAWRNLRTGRADRRGAFRMGLIAFLCDSVFWLLTVHHVSAHESDLIFERIGTQLWVAGRVWFFYLAVEPYARRLLPRTLISWSRLLAGRVRDPRVGRDLLVGMVAGMVLWLLVWLAGSVEVWKGVAPPWELGLPDIASWIHLRYTLGRLFDSIPTAVGTPLSMLVLLMLLRVLLRKQRLAIVAMIALLTLFNSGFFDSPWVAWPYALIATLLLLGVLLRFGLLALCSLFLFIVVASSHGLTTNLSSWFGAHTILVLAMMGGLAVYSFYISLAGRPLIGDSWIGAQEHP